MGFIPIPEKFEGVYDHIDGYGRTKSASYRNRLQALLFVVGVKVDGNDVRLSSVRLRAVRTGVYSVPEWWAQRHRSSKERKLPPQAPPVKRLKAAVERLKLLR